jgi:hypothetical protein
MNNYDRLVAERNSLRANTWLQQFGQTDDESTGDGKTACMLVCLQWLSLLWLGKRYSIDQVSSLAGRPASSTTGTFPSQVARFITRTGLPYKVADDKSEELSFARVVQLANERGPVIVGVKYTYHPAKRNYEYLGIKASSKPNGFALLSGKTQLNFYGSHAEVIVGSWPIAGVDLASPLGTQVWWKDPNHGSSVRPERPPYDIMNFTQSRKLYESRREFNVPLLAIYPTRAYEG